MELIVLGKQSKLFRNSRKFDDGLRAFVQTGDRALYDYLIRLCNDTGHYKGRIKSRFFQIPWSQEDVIGDIPLGRVIDTPFTYYLKGQDLLKHGLIVGQPGVGKTEALKTIIVPTLKSGCNVTIFAPKGAGDFNDFIKHGVLYLRAKDLRFNFLLPPKNVPIEEWIPRIAEAFAEAGRMLEASWGRLAEIMQQTFRKWLPKGIFPCFKELFDEAYSSSASYRKTQDYDAVIQSRLKMLRVTIEDVLSCRKGFVDRLVQDESFIIDLSGLTGVPQNFIAECLCAYIYEYHRYNGGRRIIFLDEAQHVVLSDAKQNSAKGSASAIETMIAMARGHGLGFYGVAQRGGAILDELKSDSFFRMAFNLGSGEEIWGMKKALNLTDQQTTMIQHLGIGTAIVKKSSGFTFPCLIQVYQTKMDKPTDEDWKLNEQRIKELQAFSEPYNPESTSGPEFTLLKLSKNAQKLFQAIGEKPLNLTMGFYSEAGLSGPTGGHARDKLVSLGLIEEVEIQRAGSGAKKTYCFTNTGKKAYRDGNDGKEPKEIFRTRGFGSKNASYAHDFFVNCIAADFHRNHKANFRIAENIGNQEADVIIELEGVKTAFEVTLSYTNISEKIEMLRHVNKLVYVCRNKREIGEVKKKLSIPSNLKARIDFRVVGDFLPRNS